MSEGLRLVTAYCRYHGALLPSLSYDIKKYIRLRNNESIVIGY